MKKVIIEDDKAVSPIIATILLVAITVVLAATLYTILGGYTTFLGSSTPQASVTVKEVTSSPPPIYMLYVQQFGGNISLDKVQLVVTNTNNSVYYTTLMTDLQSPGAGLGNLWNITVYGPSYLTASTVIKLSGINGASGDENISQIQLVDISTNGVIGTFSFTTL